MKEVQPTGTHSFFVIVGFLQFQPSFLSCFTLRIWVDSAQKTVTHADVVSGAKTLCHRLNYE
jgi:hypothetical protein